MYRWVSSFVFIGTVTVTSIARSAPTPVQIATCGDSKIEVVAGSGGSTGEVRALIMVPSGNRWRFMANAGLVRFGAKTRTIMVEDIRTSEITPALSRPIMPSALSIDLLLDGKKVILRHASEGGSDPAYASDLEQCSFSREGDALLAGLVPPPTETPGCAPATVRGNYRTQVTQFAKLSEADADREALALCEDHQKTIEARNRLEQAISDRAAHDRIAARGAALMRTEENRMKTWNRIDSCLGAHSSKAHGVAALHDSEAKTRSCYSQIAAKL